MPRILAHLYKHTQVCPVACLLQLLCLYSFFTAIKIAVLQQANISHTLYILWLAATGIVAMLALAMHSSCQLNSDQDIRDN